MNIVILFFGLTDRFRPFSGLCNKLYRAVDDFRGKVAPVVPVCWRDLVIHGVSNFFLSFFFLLYASSFLMLCNFQI